MRRTLFNKGLCRTAPDHYQPACARVLLEVADILPHLLDKIHLVLAFFYVGTVQPLDVIVIEDCFARLDGAKKRLHLIEQCAFEHAGIGGGGVHVIFKDVPPGEDQIVESSQRYKFVYFGSAAFGAPPQANGSHLRERSDGRCKSLPDCLYPGDKSGCYRAHAGNHDSQLALGRLNLAATLPFALCFDVLMPRRHFWLLPYEFCGM